MNEPRPKLAPPSPLIFVETPGVSADAWRKISEAIGLVCLKLSPAEDALVAQSCETFDLVGYTKASLPKRDAQLRLVTAGLQKRDVFVGSTSGSTVAIEPSGTKKFLGYAEPVVFGVATVRWPPAQYGGVLGTHSV